MDKIKLQYVIKLFQANLAYKFIAPEEFGKYGSDSVLAIYKIINQLIEEK